MVEKLTPRETQEFAIARVLAEPTRAALIGDEPGFGKTLVGAEVAIRGGFERVLFIGLKDTYDQWAERLEAQSDGRVRLRRIDATKAGRAAFDAFLTGEPGFFYAGSQFITRQDWESRREWEAVILEDDSTLKDAEGVVVRRPVFKRAKTDNLAAGVMRGDLILKDRPSGAIGPAQEPIWVTKSYRLGMYAKRLKKHPVDLIVFDEIQMIANRKSQGRQTLASIPTGFKVAMSGTWFGNAPENAWSVTRWLWPELIETNFDRWKRYWMAEVPVYGKNGKPLETARGRAITKIMGERNPGAFAATLPCYIRRENQERAPEALTVYCDPTPEQAAQIEDLKRDLMTWIKDDWKGTEMPLVVDMPAVLRIRLRQVAIAELSWAEDGSVGFAPDAASAKLAPLRGLIDNRYAGKQVGIFTDSKIGAKFVAQRMQRAGYAAEAWTGDLSSKDRDSLKRRFMAGEVRYLIGTIQSMGTGIDGLQKAANKVIWLSKVEGNPSANEQAIARYFRPGRIADTAEDQFEQVQILMTGSTDVETLERLIEKLWHMRASMQAA